MLLITTPDEADNHLITKLFDVSDLVACRGEHDELLYDYDLLVNLIQSIIEPTPWEGVGGPGSIGGPSLGKAKLLVVSQTDGVHEQIPELLAVSAELSENTPNGDLPRRTISHPNPRCSGTADRNGQE